MTNSMSSLDEKLAMVCHERSSNRRGTVFMRYFLALISVADCGLLCRDIDERTTLLFSTQPAQNQGLDTRREEALR